MFRESKGSASADEKAETAVEPPGQSKDSGVSCRDGPKPIRIKCLHLGSPEQSHMELHRSVRAQVTHPHFLGGTEAQLKKKPLTHLFSLPFHSL